MKKILINSVILIIIIFVLYLALNTKKEITIKTLDIGNQRIQVEVLGVDPENDSIMHDIKIIDKNTGKNILVKNTDPYHMIINDISYDDRYIITNTGTSGIRSISVYDFDTGVEKSSFCNYGDYRLVEHTILYSDCTIDHKFDFRSTIVENGEYNPIVYKLNIDTAQKEVLLKSDDLNKYIFEQHPKNKYNVRISSVKSFRDWSDTSKWEESFTTVK